MAKRKHNQWSLHYQDNLITCHKENLINNKIKAEKENIFQFTRKQEKTYNHDDVFIFFLKLYNGLE